MQNIIHIGNFKNFRIPHRFEKYHPCQIINIEYDGVNWNIVKENQIKDSDIEQKINWLEKSEEMKDKILIRRL